MNYKLFTLLFLLIPFLAFSQEKKHKISFIFFNDLNSNKKIRSNFSGQYELPKLLMDNEVYNLTVQIDYERLIKKNTYFYGVSGIMNKDFKTIIGAHAKGPREIYLDPIRQRYSFFTFGIGLKNYYNLFNLKLYSKLGVQSSRSLKKPNNFSWDMGSENIRFEEHLHSFFLGFGLTNQIINKLSYKIEVDFSRSMNPIIIEFPNSKVNTVGLGFCLEYAF